MYNASAESCDAGTVPGVGYKLIALVLRWQSECMHILQFKTLNELLFGEKMCCKCSFSILFEYETT